MEDYSLKNLPSLSKRGIIAVHDVFICLVTNMGMHTTHIINLTKADDSNKILREEDGQS